MRPISFYFKQIWALFAILVLFAGCDESLEFNNTPPGDLEIEKNICYLATGKTLALCGTGEDPDGDLVSFRWTSAYGTFIPADGRGQCVGWVAPQTAGTYQVTLIATDELVESSKTENIVVGQELILLPGDRDINDNGSFYMVNALVPLQVGFRTTLTLHSGVTIIIANIYGGFAVEGTLNVLGTEADPVILKSDACGEDDEKWGGISFTGENAIGILKHLNINDAEIAIGASDQAQVTIDTCTIVDCDEAVSITDSAEVDITGCKIWDNGGGVKSFYSSTTIRGSSVRYNGLYGVWIGGNDGLYRADIQYSNISNNTSYGGFRISGYSIPFVRNCAIFSNSYGVYMSEYFAGGTLNFTLNYWGLSDSLSISQNILDRHDIPSGAFVNFVPWLTSSPVGD